jgi:hypothetical protein
VKRSERLWGTLFAFFISMACMLSTNVPQKITSAAMVAVFFYSAVTPDEPRDTAQAKERQR